MALSRKDITIAVIFSVVLFGSIGGVIFHALFLNVGPFWPTIDNPSKLLQDCSLMSKNEQGFIEDVNWPESVKALSPVAVYGEKEFIEIKISGGGVGCGWGYLVFPNARTDKPTLREYDIREYVSPGIFKYTDYEH